MKRVDMLLIRFTALLMMVLFFQIAYAESLPGKVVPVTLPHLVAGLESVGRVSHRENSKP